MLTQNQENIIIELMEDNNLIFIGSNAHFDSNTIQHIMINSILKYCQDLFMEFVYEPTDNYDGLYVQCSLVNMAYYIVKCRGEYKFGSLEYKIFNSFYDKTLEAIREFNETLIGR